MSLSASISTIQTAAFFMVWWKLQRFVHHILCRLLNMILIIYPQNLVFTYLILMILECQFEV